MLISLLIVSFWVLFLGLSLSMWVPGEAPIVFESAITMTELLQHGGKGGSHGNKGHLFKESALMGGFARVTIIKDSPEISITFDDDFNPHLAEADFFRPTDGAGVDFDSSGAGIGYGDNDFGLPKENWLLPIKPMFDLPEKKIEVPKGNRNGMILVSNIDWPGMPAKDSDTGRVVVDITIHENATISYDFVSVEPEGKGFRTVTEKAITQRFRYSPKTNRGEPVETTIRLSITICLTCELSLHVTSAKDMHVGAIVD
jgi:hypothetical protein